MFSTVKVTDSEKDDVVTTFTNDTFDPNEKVNKNQKHIEARQRHFHLRMLIKSYSSYLVGSFNPL